MIAMLVIILLMIEVSFLAGAKEELEDAFNDPNWMNKEEEL
jgi:uncharacterized membrane protein YkvI